MADVTIIPHTYTVICRVCGTRRDGLRAHEVRRFEQDHQHGEAHG